MQQYIPLNLRVTTLYEARVRFGDVGIMAAMSSTNLRQLGSLTETGSYSIAVTHCSRHSSCCSAAAAFGLQDAAISQLSAGRECSGNHSSSCCLRCCCTPGLSGGHSQGKEFMLGRLPAARPAFKGHACWYSSQHLPCFFSEQHC